MERAVFPLGTCGRLVGSSPPLPLPRAIAAWDGSANSEKGKAQGKWGPWGSLQRALQERGWKEGCTRTHSKGRGSNGDWLGGFGALLLAGLLTGFPLQVGCTMGT